MVAPTLPPETPWPDTPDGLAELQRMLATATPPPWHPPSELTVAGCFACLPRGHTGRGETGDPVWAAAAAYRATVAADPAVPRPGRQCLARATATGRAGGPYRPGLLALRVGPPLAAAVRALPQPPDVLLVDATGDDHPRRAGLAVQLGAVLGLPTAGVTHRPLLAEGAWPPDETGAASPLLLDGQLVGYWLRTRAGRRPIAVHAGWRTAPDPAVQVVRAVAWHRTPAPLREARRLARIARAAAPGPPGRSSN